MAKKRREHAAETKREFQPPPLTPKTPRQAEYIKAIASNDLIFATGPAGTGKTFISAAMAVEAFLLGNVERIIVTRPAVEAAESIGFLPGTLDEKFAPYFEPVKIALQSQLGAEKCSSLMKMGIIRAIPLNFVRGLTFEGAFVILDEAQNTTRKEMKLFLTRLGENTRAVVEGDLEQSDIGDYNGLEDAISRMTGAPGVAKIAFQESDIVRSGLVREVIIRYRHALPVRPEAQQ